MKKLLIIIIIIVVVIFIGLILLLLRGFSGEDDWIKDSRGVYVKHGVPSTTPVYVNEQQDSISCAIDLYNQAKSNSMQFDSQCLGACGNYSVDIVHNPRTIEDDKSGNQCSDYPRVTPYFIELDSKGNVVRVA